MTIHKLKELLEDYELDGYGDLEVKVAFQPRYPLETEIRTTCRIGKTFWIATSEADGYAPNEAWDGEDIDDDEDADDEGNE